MSVQVVGYFVLGIQPSNQEIARSLSKRPIQRMRRFALSERSGRMPLANDWVFESQRGTLNPTPKKAVYFFSLSPNVNQFELLSREKQVLFLFLELSNYPSSCSEGGFDLLLGRPNPSEIHTLLRIA